MSEGSQVELIPVFTVRHDLLGGNPGETVCQCAAGRCFSGEQKLSQSGWLRPRSFMDVRRDEAACPSVFLMSLEALIDNALFLYSTVLTSSAQKI